MTTLKDKTKKCESWKSVLQRSYLSWELLLSYLDLKPEQMESKGFNPTKFPLKVTRQYASRIEKRNPADPLLQQIIPRKEEQNFNPLFTDDPLQEASTQKTTNVLIQKYSNRALLIATGSCAIHCRYCFRKNFPYNEKIGRGRIESALDELKDLTEIDEVILSGGDPLMLDDAKLNIILKHISDYPHIRRVRIHSRVPVVFPPRVTLNLLELLSGRRYSVILVTHINHPNEIDREVRLAVSSLREHGVTLLNQSVLLRHINDDHETLVELSNKLFEIGILPYYMHMLDKVTGTSHFQVQVNVARTLQRQLYSSMPAYLVPRFVKEIPGSASKTLI